MAGQQLREELGVTSHGGQGDGGHRRTGRPQQRIRAIFHKQAESLVVTFVFRRGDLMFHDAVQRAMRPGGGGEHIGISAVVQQEPYHLVTALEAGMHHRFPRQGQFAVGAQQCGGGLEIAGARGLCECPFLLRESYALSMTDETELITVYRSADSNAGEDAKAIQDLLLKGGFDARLLGDDSPGVVEGAYEVRVPQAEGEAAEALIGERATADDPIVPVDPSHYLDLVTVAMTDGTTGEMEAMSIKSVLDANQIDSVIVGNSTLPTMGFEVRVAEEEKRDAEAAIAEAKSAGAEAALEAEQAGEGPV